MIRKHNYKATWNRMEGIIVVDGKGKEVKVEYASTVDNRTMYAYVPGVGYIGGWQWPHKAMPFKHLATCINRGILYTKMEDLPTASTRTYNKNVVKAFNK